MTPLQRSTEGLSHQVWDAAVVGAGPAGSLAALRLRELGHSVLLLDRKDFPRDKACGDGLIPDSLRVLRRIGLEEHVRRAGRTSSQCVLFSPARVRIEIPGDFIVLRRHDFDEMLAREAVRRGAVFVRGRVAAIQPAADRTDGLASIEVNGDEERIRARAVVLATGADVSLLQAQTMIRRPEPSGFAARCYVRSALDIEGLVLSFDRDVLPGYGWIFPLRNGEYNVGCGVFGLDRDRRVDLRSLFDRFVSAFPLACDLLRRGEVVSPLKGARLRCGLTGSEPVRSNVVAVGETIGTTYPATGEGIGKAMETGQLAADVIGEALASDDVRRLLDYPRRIKEELQAKYRSYSVAERWLSRAWLADFVARRVRKSEYLNAALAGIVSETAEPTAIFSARGLIRSAWR